MTSSMVVPVIDVQNDNFRELWPSMVLAIKTSSFIAVDTELSGLGTRKALLAESIEDRYKAICHAARTRSILSLGIACFKKLHDKAADTYQVQVYNLTLLCSEEYVIEPQSVKFLVQHGFDFNKQYSQGVSYCKGNAKDSDRQGVSIRSLFTELLRSRKPLALHNGLIDMVFLYQCFYAHLPERLTTFTADLSQMFPAGVYDTKYVTEYELRLQASYLEYAYKKCKLDNLHGIEKGGVKGQLHLEFCIYSPSMAGYVDYRTCLAGAIPEGSLDVCTRFSAFGWCPNGAACPQSHDTDLIIHQDDQIKQSKTEKRKQRKRKRKNTKGGGGAQADDLSIFDGAPENKISNMELEEARDQGTSAENCPETMFISGAASAGEPHQMAMLSPSADSGTKTEEATGNGAMEAQTSPPAPPPPTSTTPLNDAAKMAASKKLEGGTHRAGFDAFMTGFIFAYASTTLSGQGREGGGEGKEEWLPSCLNKVYLSGKSTPLNIVKSTFSKSSKAHSLNMEWVWGKTVASTLLEQARPESV